MTNGLETCSGKVLCNMVNRQHGQNLQCAEIQTETAGFYPSLPPTFHIDIYSNIFFELPESMFLFDIAAISSAQYAFEISAVKDNGLNCHIPADPFLQVCVLLDSAHNDKNIGTDTNDIVQFV